jgi:signal transduction histidine kinase
MNLAVNALDAMPQGGSLSLDVELRARDAQLTVADTGVGIPATRREKIFGCVADSVGRICEKTRAPG